VIHREQNPPTPTALFRLAWAALDLFLRLTYRPAGGREHFRLSAVSAIDSDQLDRFRARQLSVDGVAQFGQHQVRAVAVQFLRVTLQHTDQRAADFPFIAQPQDQRRALRTLRIG